jgi:uncharacterized Tic20 family protein
MKNTDLAKKIKELRTRKGFSQDQLAETAQINLRTVQRIEAGETEPRGDTLKRLASALNVTPDEMIDWAEQEDNNFLMFVNLSALAYIVFPLLGVIIPMTLWMSRKDKIRHLNEMGKRLLNFQISWCVFMFVVYALVMSAVIFHVHIPVLRGSVGSMEVALIAIALLYLSNAIFIIVNSYRSAVGLNVFYKPALRILK